MNIIPSPANRLFELARSGQRLPHIILAIVLTFVFVLVAQFTGGLLAVLVVLLLSVSQTGMPSSLDNPDVLMALIMPDTALEQAIFLILAFGPIFILLWAWMALFEKRPFWTMGVEKLGWWVKYLRGLLVGLIMFVAAIGISALFGYIAFEQGDPQQQGVYALAGVLLVLLGWIVQGAAEEALTRGWLLPVVGARYTPLWGIIVSSILFAMLHSFNPNLSIIAVLNLFLFGLFAALYALREGSVWGVFGIHTVWNWALGNLFGFEVSGQAAPGGTLFNLMEVGPDAITGGPFGPEGGLSVTVVLVASCIVVWLQGRGKTPQMSKNELTS